MGWEQEKLGVGMANLNGILVVARSAVLVVLVVLGLQVQVSHCLPTFVQLSFMLALYHG